MKLSIYFRARGSQTPTGDLVHAFVFSLFPPEVSESLHKEKEKPFSIRDYRLSENGMKLGLSLLRDELFPPLVGQYYLSKGAYALGDVELTPLVPGGIKEEESMSYEELLALEPLPAYSVDFLKPTVFRRGRWDYPLPDPEVLFRSLYRKWSCFYEFPLKEEELLHGVYAEVYILGHKIRVETVELSFGRLRGFVGNVVFGVKSMELSRLVHALLKFGEFSGVGRKSTMGMGVMRLRSLEDGAP